MKRIHINADSAVRNVLPPCLWDTDGDLEYIKNWKKAAPLVTQEVEPVVENTYQIGAFVLGNTSC